MGTPEQDGVLARRVTDEVGAAVALVRYRLAPEDP